MATAKKAKIHPATLRIVPGKSDSSQVCPWTNPVNRAADRRLKTAPKSSRVDLDCFSKTIGSPAARRQKERHELTATLNDNSDMCFNCRRAPAAAAGMCLPCFERSVWYLDPPLGDL